MTGRPEAAEPRKDLSEYVRQLVADWPPLTEDQRTSVAGLLRPCAAANPVTSQPSQDVAA